MLWTPELNCIPFAICHIYLNVRELREISDISGFCQVHNMTRLIWGYFVVTSCNREENWISLPWLLWALTLHYNVFLVGGDNTEDELWLDHIHSFCRCKICSWEVVLTFLEMAFLLGFMNDCGKITLELERNLQRSSNQGPYFIKACSHYTIYQLN